MNKSCLLEAIDEGLSTTGLSKRFELSPTTIRYWLKKYGLRTKYEKYNRVTWNGCKVCGEGDPAKFHKAKRGLKHLCKECFKEAYYPQRLERLRSAKQEAVRYKGGKCEKCGYDRCLMSLEFHHKNPEDKDPQFRGWRHWPTERQHSELDKCELLCSNCHGEVHWMLECNKTMVPGV